MYSQLQGPMEELMQMALGTCLVITQAFYIYSSSLTRGKGGTSVCVSLCLESDPPSVLFLF